MRNLKITVVLALTGLMLSCSPQKQEERKDYLHQIDSLLTELRILDDSLNTLNIREVQRINDSLSLYYDTTQVQDTQERKFRLYEQSRDILQWYGNVNREINYSRSHLRALKDEFKNPDIPDSTKRKKLQKEKQIIVSIQERFDEEYESLGKEVKELLNSQQHTDE